MFSSRATDILNSLQLSRLDRLRGEMDPVLRFASVPGIGTVLTEHLHCDLGIATLEDLAAAAHDGRLAEIAGVGEKKVAGIIASLATRLGRVRVLVRLPATDAPPVEERLDVDREYREQAAVGKRRRTAPRRFNPSGEVWLPVLHTQRGERHYTALCSNLARAHQVGKPAMG